MMSREIKFRMWEKTYSRSYKMTYDPCILEPDGKPHEYFGVASLNAAINNEITAGNVLMQYTGLKDRNDKDIYEGDIVKLYHKNFIVKFGTYNNGHFHGYKINGVGFYLKEQPFLTETLSLDKEYKNLYEVIGNIYENHELLDKEIK